MFNYKKLKELRLKKGINLSDLQMELYRQYGVKIARNTLGNWEEGRRPVNINHIGVLADFYSVEISVFFCSKKANKTGEVA